MSTRGAQAGVAQARGARLDPPRSVIPSVLTRPSDAWPASSYWMTATRACFASPGSACVPIASLESPERAKLRRVAWYRPHPPALIRLVCFPSHKVRRSSFFSLFYSSSRDSKCAICFRSFVVALRTRPAVRSSNRRYTSIKTSTHAGSLAHTEEFVCQGHMSDKSKV